MNRKKIISKAAKRMLNTALSMAIVLTMLVLFMMPVKVSAAETAAKPTFPPISVSVKGEGLSVSWKKVTGAVTYKVYRSYSKTTGYKCIKAGITGRSFLDKKVKSGKRAYYKVRAVAAKDRRLCTSKPGSGKIYRVYIETGHGTGIDGRWDPGCLWNGYQEAKIMPAICRYTAAYLKNKGVYVYTDAYTGNNRNLKWTLNQLKTLDVSVFLNVHCDYQYAPSGTLGLYRTAKQKRLADCLNKGVSKYVKIRNRGLQYRTDLATLNETPNCVACLYETGGIKADNTLLRTQYVAYGKGLAKGVCDYLGIAW